jgi:hypothetical protein
VTACYRAVLAGGRVPDDPVVGMRRLPGRGHVFGSMPAGCLLIHRPVHDAPGVVRELRAITGLPSGRAAGRRR